MNKTAIRKRAKQILEIVEDYSYQCHVASLKLVTSGLGDRVARGWCDGVGSQHSWVVIGNPYSPDLIIDPTLWSYRQDVKGIFVGDGSQYNHRPHGKGSIWEWGCPRSGDDKPIKLTPKIPLSEDAQMFLSMVGGLDKQGWSNLSHAPVEDWPSAEIFAAMDDTKELACLVPIDILGMLTDRNPSRLYK